MQSGSLKRRIAIDQRDEAQDPNTGEMIPTWTVFASEVSANIEPLRGTEFLVAHQEQSQVFVKITIRWRAGMLPTMRVRALSDGTIYNIAGILPDSKTGREFLILTCGTGVNDG